MLHDIVSAVSTNSLFSCAVPRRMASLHLPASLTLNAFPGVPPHARLVRLLHPEQSLRNHLSSTPHALSLLSAGQGWC
jgi:hypothetical protein